MKVFLLVLILNFESGMTSLQYIHNVPTRVQCEYHGKRLLHKSFYKDFYCMEVLREAEQKESILIEEPENNDDEI